MRRRLLASWAGGAAGLARRLLLGHIARKGEAELGCGEEMGQRERELGCAAARAENREG